MSKNLSSAAVVIGVLLRVKMIYLIFYDKLVNVGEK